MLTSYTPSITKPTTGAAYAFSSLYDAEVMESKEVPCRRKTKSPEDFQDDATNPTPKKCFLRQKLLK